MGNCIITRRGGGGYSVGDTMHFTKLGLPNFIFKKRTEALQSYSSNYYVYGGRVIDRYAYYVINDYSNDTYSEKRVNLDTGVVDTLGTANSYNCSNFVKTGEHTVYCFNPTGRKSGNETYYECRAYNTESKARAVTASISIDSYGYNSVIMCGYAVDNNTGCLLMVNRGDGSNGVYLYKWNREGTSDYYYSSRYNAQLLLRQYYNTTGAYSTLSPFVDTHICILGDYAYIPTTLGYLLKINISTMTMSASLIVAPDFSSYDSSVRGANRFCYTDGTYLYCSCGSGNTTSDPIGIAKINPDTMEVVANWWADSDYTQFTINDKYIYTDTQVIDKNSMSVIYNLDCEINSADYTPKFESIYSEFTPHRTIRHKETDGVGIIVSEYTDFATITD